MIKFDHRKLAKATNIHFVAQVKQYLRDAKNCIHEEFVAEKDPKRKKELEEGSYYIERLQENLCEKLSKPDFSFKASDLGL
tara:strand:- start:15 stop:257 length:243 start_codon:yes stop_codon:yes gene_type:complete